MYLSAIHVFNGRFAEREIHVIAVSERADEIGRCRPIDGSVGSIRKQKQKKII